MPVKSGQKSVAKEVILLTKESVEKLSPRPGESARVVYDTKLKGFGVRVSTSVKAFFVYYRQGGGRGAQQRRVSLGRFGVVAVAQARDQAAKLLAEAREGKDPIEERRAAIAAEAAKATVAEFGARYLDKHSKQHKRPKSHAEDVRHFEKEIAPRFGKMTLEEIRREHVRQWLDGFHDRPTTGNRCLSLLSHLFSKAEEWGVLPDGVPNPTRRIQKYREAKRDRFLGHEEIIEVGQWLARLEASAWYRMTEGDKHAEPRPLAEGEKAPKGAEVFLRLMPEQGQAIRLLLLSGCRLREVTEMRWREVDFERKALRLSEDRAKTGAREVPLPEAAIELLKALPRQEGSPYVFTGRKTGTPIDASALRKSWVRLCSLAGLENARVHDLRHTVASQAVGLGIGLPVIGAVLGHRQASTTQRYAHVAQSPAMAAANKVGAHISGALKSGEARAKSSGTGESESEATA